MLGMTERKLLAEGASPWLLEPASNERDIVRAVNDNRAELDARLLEHGALLFRGFDVSSVDGFEAFANAISAHKSDYVYRSTPRTSIGNGIFTATEYPPSETISLHCENAYQRNWPLRVAFCCLTAPAAGGETPIADMREVSRKIGPRILDDFEAKQVRYVRHYRRHVDIPWETVFQTSDRGQLAAFCAENGIEHAWLDDDTLRTAQINQGVAYHPVTRDRVFFNQAHLFHISNLDASLASSIVSLFGNDRLPRNAFYGDGSPLDLADIEQIRNAFRECAIAFPWQRGDVLLVDNMRFAHGRNPFEGERKVVVSLLDPYSPA
ncbi:taurine catabolism dioxygenase TauD [Burkholderia ubonensis]|uniref:TauD/TfdA family dioxygenase n=1 Tax=Burkholderia ubonensis TaxID=101571 RepID=UPI00075DC1B8|nr:TauD/TfdA family dioxygenase [Burkholderia ubonensis]KVU29080.1 taurine catabolism dioxygenase TauD [Burkholderia ubonensis]KVV52776.1 taurine catabolism dioxygenase TauD [Burkholderia ubonensis]KVW22461.1 taurine catabolism dioxygenase TauD [Burkholderia ubonensis]